MRSTIKITREDLNTRLSKKKTIQNICLQRAHKAQYLEVRQGTFEEAFVQFLTDTVRDYKVNGVSHLGLGVEAIGKLQKTQKQPATQAAVISQVSRLLFNIKETDYPTPTQYATAKQLIAAHSQGPSGFVSFTLELKPDKECGFLKLKIEPTLNNIETILPGTRNIAYVRYQNGFYYLNKAANECACITQDSAAIQAIDTKFPREKDLSSDDLKFIYEQTKYTPDHTYALVVKSLPSLSTYNLAVVSIQPDQQQDIAKISAGSNENPVLAKRESDGAFFIYGFNHQNKKWLPVQLTTKTNEERNALEAAKQLFLNGQQETTLNYEDIPEALRQVIFLKQIHTVQTPYQIITDHYINPLDSPTAALMRPDTYLISKHPSSAQYTPILYYKDYRGNIRKIEIDDVIGLKTAIEENDHSKIKKALNLYRAILGQNPNYSYDKEQQCVLFVSKHEQRAIVSEYDVTTIAGVVGPAKSVWKLKPEQAAFELDYVETTDTFIETRFNDVTFDDALIKDQLAAQGAEQDIEQQIEHDFQSAYKKAQLTFPDKNEAAENAKVVVLTQYNNDYVDGKIDEVVLQKRLQILNALSRSLHPSLTTATTITTTTSSITPPPTAESSAPVNPDYTNPDIFTVEQLEQSQNIVIADFKEQGWIASSHEQQSARDLLDWIRETMHFKGGKALSAYQSEVNEVEEALISLTDEYKITKAKARKTYVKRCQNTLNTLGIKLTVTHDTPLSVMLAAINVYQSHEEKASDTSQPDIAEIKGKLTKFTQEYQGALVKAKETSTEQCQAYLHALGMNTITVTSDFLKNKEFILVKYREYLYCQERDRFFQDHSTLKDAFDRHYAQLFSDVSRILTFGSMNSGSPLTIHNATSFAQTVSIEDNTLYLDVTLKDIALAEPAVEGMKPLTEEELADAKKKGISAAELAASKLPITHRIPGELKVRFAFVEGPSEQALAEETPALAEEEEGLKKPVAGFRMQHIDANTDALKAIVMEKYYNYDDPAKKHRIKPRAVQPRNTSTLKNKAQPATNHDDPAKKHQIMANAVPSKDNSTSQSKAEFTAMRGNVKIRGGMPGYQLPESNSNAGGSEPPTPPTPQKTKRHPVAQGLSNLWAAFKKGFTPRNLLIGAAIGTLAVIITVAVVASHGALAPAAFGAAAAATTGSTAAAAALVGVKAALGLLFTTVGGTIGTAIATSVGIIAGCTLLAGIGGTIKALAGFCFPRNRKAKTATPPSTDSSDSKNDKQDPAPAGRPTTAIQQGLAAGKTPPPPPKAQQRTPTAAATATPPAVNIATLATKVTQDTRKLYPDLNDEHGKTPLLNAETQGARSHLYPDISNEQEEKLRLEGKQKDKPKNKDKGKEKDRSLGSTSQEDYEEIPIAAVSILAQSTEPVVVEPVVTTIATETKPEEYSYPPLPQNPDLGDWGDSIPTVVPVSQVYATQFSRQSSSSSNSPPPRSGSSVAASRFEQALQGSSYGSKYRSPTHSRSNSYQ